MNNNYSSNNNITNNTNLNGGTTDVLVDQYLDEKENLRISLDNPDVQKLYKDFLGSPNGEKAEKLLHTHYTKQDCYIKG